MNSKVAFRIERSDGKQFVIDNTDWLIPSDGLENWCNMPIEVSCQDAANLDGGFVEKVRVASIDRTIIARIADKSQNDTWRQKIIAFFSPRFTYIVHVTYQGVTRWCQGVQMGFRCDTGNIYEPIKFTWTLFSTDPFMMSEDDFGKDIANIIPKFGFPLQILLAAGTELTRSQESTGLVSFKEGYQPLEIYEATTYGKTQVNLFGGWSQTDYANHGVTFHVNEDSSIKVQGTSTNQNSLLVSNYLPIVPSRKYTVSWNSVNSSDEPYFLQIAILKEDATTHWLACYSDVTTFVADSDATSMRCIIKVTGEVNTTIRATLVEGDTPQPWSPYGITNITRDDIYAAGKNFFNAGAIGEQYIKNGITVDVRADGLKITGNPIDTNGHTNFVLKPSEHLPNGEYTVSAQGRIPGIGIVVPSNPGSVLSIAMSAEHDERHATAEIIEGVYHKYELNISNSLTNLDFLVKPQLEVGNVVTPYEPYMPAVSTLINLQGNELCSLPNGTSDEVVATETGVDLIKRTAKQVITSGAHSSEQYQDTYRCLVTVPTIPEGVETSSEVYNDKGLSVQRDREHLIFYGSQFTSDEASNAFLAETRPEVVYQSVEEEVHLPGVQLPTISSSVVNVWSDTNMPQTNSAYKVRFTQRAGYQTGFIAGLYEYGDTIEVINDGDLETPFRVEMTATGDVAGATILKGAKFVKIVKPLHTGEKLVIDFFKMPPEVEIDGVNSIQYVDRRSSFVGMDLDLGKNTISYAADSGQENLQVVLFWRKRYLGV